MLIENGRLHICVRIISIVMPKKKCLRTLMFIFAGYPLPPARTNCQQVQRLQGEIHWRPLHDPPLKNALRYFRKL